MLNLFGIGYNTLLQPRKLFFGFLEQNARQRQFQCELFSTLFNNNRSILECADLFEAFGNPVPIPLNLFLESKKRIAQRGWLFCVGSETPKQKNSTPCPHTRAKKAQPLCLVMMAPLHFFPLLSFCALLRPPPLLRQSPFFRQLLSQDPPSLLRSAAPPPMLPLYRVLCYAA